MSAPKFLLNWQAWTAHKANLCAWERFRSSQYWTSVHCYRGSSV